MSQSAKRIVLASRPVGEPKPDNFRLEDYPVPVPGEGQILLRTVWLSLDPYMRGRMDDGPSYSAPVPIGGVMEGGTVAEVVESKSDRFRPGDIVMVGRESAGVPPEVYAAAEASVHIPMRRDLRSLNVAMAAAMVVGEALRQLRAYPEQRHERV